MLWEHKDGAREGNVRAVSYSGWSPGHTGGETPPKEKAVWAEGKGRGDWLQKPVSKTECGINTGSITTEVLQALWWISQYQAIVPKHIDI